MGHYHEEVSALMHRFIRFALVAALPAIIVGCGKEETITKDPPQLLTLSPSTAGAGDTVVVTGEGFNTLPSSNRLVIAPNGFGDPQARRVSVVLSGTRTRLVGVVPDGAFQGQFRVEDGDPLGPALSFGVAPPAAPSNALPFHVRLADGDVGKAFFAAPGYTFTLSAGTADEDYLFVLFNSVVPPSDTSMYQYSIDASLGTAALAGRADVMAQSLPPMVRQLPEDPQPAWAPGRVSARQRDFDGNVRRQIDDLLRRAHRAAAPSDAPIRSVVPTSSAAAPSRTFNIFVNPSGDIQNPADFTTITADLKFTGAHTLLYVDQETPADFLTQDEANALGNAFDGSIYQTDRSNFGNESDINHDGKVAILMSPVVNRMTPAGTAGSQGLIGGFFLPNDLLPGLLDGRVTNGMEIFYSIVPDPTGRFGNVFSKDKTFPIIDAVLAHEFLHMILFNYRVLIYGQGVSGAYLEDLWLNEGLAHIAEDLNGFKTSNIGRANLFLADPGSTMLIYGGDELAQRGAAFLFLRYLGDRYGDAIYRQLVQTKDKGVVNVQARTGLYFKEIFSDWSAATYMSGRGITSDPRFAYTSLNLLADFGPLDVLAGSFSPGTMSGFVKAMAPEYIFFSVPAGDSATFTIEAPPGSKSRMNAVVVRAR
jgi:hypothetical protein